MINLIPVIIISSDAMKAILYIEQSKAPQLMATGVTVRTIEAALELAGILIPPTKGLLEGLVEEHHNGKDISGSVIVSGKPPKSTSPDKISAYGDLKFPVFPGDQFGYFFSANSQKNGMNVLGEIVHPANINPSTKAVTLSPNKSIIEKDGELTAMRYGLVKIENGEIGITSLLKLSKDLMTLSGTLYPKDYLGNSITQERMIIAIRAMGLKRRINELLLETGLEKAHTTGAPVFGIALCSGLRPFKGEKGWIEMFISQNEELLAGQIDKDGNIDYKQRGTIETVQKGDVLALIHPPGEGRPGKNLLGDLVAPEKGLPYFVSLGENVTQVGQELIAAAGGFFIHKDNSFMVSEVYSVSGDVGLHTGHISLERGSVIIENSVLSGFHVSCPKNILIKGTVENSILTAGGDIDIYGGIIMNNTGLIRATGSVRALFGIGTNIHAGVNVYIMNGVNKSKILAEDSIFITGSLGKAVGGILHCGKEIQATQIGSELCVPTTIRLGIDEAFLEEYRIEKTRMGQSLDHIQNKLVHSSDEEIIASYPKDKLPTVMHILTVRKQLSNRVSEVSTTIDRLEAQLNKQTYCSLQVNGVIYPGTTVHCGTEQMTVDTPIYRSKIVFNFNDGQFKITRI